jgi:hypothetical protein
MISVDPQITTQLNTIKSAMAGLTSQMSKLASEAERYARAMGAVAGSGMGSFGTGGRPANFPQVTRPGVAVPRGPMGFSAPIIGTAASGAGQAAPAAPGRGGISGFLSGLGGVELAVLAPQLMRMMSSQISNVIQRERVTTRLGMAQTGPYSGTGAAQPWQQMLRSAPGYTSTGDVYAGAQTLGQLGLMRAPNDPRTQQVVRQTGLAAIMGGTNYQGAAQMEAGFMSPQTVNALRQGVIGGRMINATPGGNLQLFGQQGLLEQMYGAVQPRTGGQRGEQFWRTALRPGSPMYQSMQAAGMSPEQMQLMQQYGIARAEPTAGGGQRSAADVQKTLQKRYEDTGETLRQLQASWSEFKDLVSTGLVPVIKALNTSLRPLVNLIDFISKKLPQADKVFGALIGALIAWQLKVRIASAFEGTGAVGKFGSMAGGTRLGGMMGGAEGIGTAVGSAFGYGAAGMIGGQILQSAVGGEHGTARSRIGGALGGAARGAGLGAGIGGILGAGVLSWASAPVGAAIGAGIGGVWGALTGDAWPEWMRDGVGDSDATPKPPSGGPASGKDLRGAKTSDSNMNPEFVKRLQQMFTDNPNLSLTSGWRDAATQARLYKEKPGLAAPPGHSNHEKGLAADIGPASEYNWIAANAGKYGLFLPMPVSADRKAKGQKIEPWHVEGTGITGGTTASAKAAAPVTASTTTATAKTKAATKAVSPEVRTSTVTGPGGGAWQEATAIQSTLGGSQIGDAWEGDNTVVFPYTTGGGSQSRGTGGNLTIGRIEINLTIARGTPEEAERTARYLGTLLGDRERMIALARGTAP